MERQPTKIASLLGNRLVRHGLFWLVIVLSYPIASLAMQQSFLSALIVKLFYLPTQIVAAYLLVYFQLPQLLYKKRYGYFALSIFLSAYLLGALTHGMIDHVLVPAFSPESERSSWQKILFGFDQADASLRINEDQTLIRPAQPARGLNRLMAGMMNLGDEAYNANKSRWNRRSRDVALVANPKRCYHNARHAN